jgi:hypothetical protein
MNGRRSVFAAAGLALLVARGALAAEEKPTSLETARWAAGINASSAQGRAWMDRNSASIGRLVVPVLNRCLPESSDEITAFSVFLRLSRAGRVREVVTDVDASLSACMTRQARELQLPAAPRDDYWIQLNLAAPL